MRQARKREKGSTPLKHSSRALLCGKVFCAHCGNRLTLTSSGRTRTRADGSEVHETRARYSCHYKVRHPGQCDGQSGYGVTKLDGIVESVVRMKFAEVRECSKQKLLEEMQAENLDQARKQVEKLERDLQTRRQEQDVLKEETILVIQGKSALDRDTLAEMMAETKAAVIKAGEDLQKAKAEEQALQEATKKMKRDCDDLFTWANAYDGANFNERQAILHQFIKQVRVGRNYEVEIVLNVSLEEFEEFKAHSMANSTRKRAQKNLKQAPQKPPTDSKKSVVTLDEDNGLSLGLLPNIVAHASISYGG